MNLDIRSLKTKADYDRALAEIERYFVNPPPVDTPEAERFDILAAVIEAYETHHWPIDPPDPANASIHSVQRNNPA